MGGPWGPKLCGPLLLQGCPRARGTWLPAQQQGEQESREHLHPAGEQSREPGGGLPGRPGPGPAPGSRRKQWDGFPSGLQGPRGGEVAVVSRGVSCPSVRSACPSLLALAPAELAWQAWPWAGAAPDSSPPHSGPRETRAQVLWPEQLGVRDPPAADH